MQNYFANFIKTGNPNGSGLVEWPAAQANNPTPPVMIIDTECKTENSKIESRYQFLDISYGNQ